MTTPFLRELLRRSTLPRKLLAAPSARSTTTAELPPPGSEESRTEQSRLLSLSSTEEARACVPIPQADQLNILPLGIISLYGREGILVASPPPHNNHTYTSLRFITGREVRLVAADPLVIAEARFRAYHGSDSALRAATTVPANPSSRTKPPQTTIDFRPTSSDAARILASIVDYGISKQASDIHLIPRENGMFLRIRIDGEMMTHDTPLCSPSVNEQIVQRIKVLAALDTTARGTPLDGVFSVPLPMGKSHVRVSIIPTVHGERAVLRLASNRTIPTLANLGLHPLALQWLVDVAHRAEGAILFVGATGSGKTTTMYSLLNFLAARELNIVSIEDPVEVRLASASQTQLDVDRGLTYAHALRSILRQDPDVILLGEMRDTESASIAIQAAMTGHLLLSTLHARTPLEVPLRLEQLGIARTSIAQAVQLILCQRLIPALCQSCKTPDIPSSQLLRHPVFTAKGCPECSQKGHRGRVMITEALRITPEMVRAIETGSSLRELPKSTLTECYLSSAQSSEQLLHNGQVSCEDILEILAS